MTDLDLDYSGLKSMFGNWHVQGLKIFYHHCLFDCSLTGPDKDLVFIGHKLFYSECV